MMWQYLRSSLAALAIALTLSLPVTAGAAGDEQTINPIPTPASGQWLDQLELFLNREDADRYTLIHDDFVSSGGVISTGAGLTKTPTSLVAFIGGFYTTESGNITFADNETTWVIASKDRTGDLGTFTRVSGTHYLTDSASATEPALPADTVWISEVTTSGGSVTAVTDMRALTPDGITATDTGTVRFDAGVRTIGDVRPEAYTVANLPSTCTEGTIAVLADGDAAGAIVQCGGTAPADADTWYCLSFYGDRKVIDISCPPWNADSGAADNSAAIQAALTKQETEADNSIWFTIFVPPRTYTVTSGLRYDTNRAGVANTTAGLTLVGAAKTLSAIKCNYTGATPCLHVGGSGAAQNLVSIRNIGFVDGASTPDFLVYFNPVSQGEVVGAFIGDAAMTSLRIQGGTHNKVLNSIFAHESALYIEAITTQDLTVSGNTMEAIDNGSSSFFKLAGTNSSEISVVNNHQRGGEIVKFVECANTTGSAVEGLTVSGNSTLETQIGIDCTPGGSGLVDRFNFSENLFRSIDDGSGTQGINVGNMLDGIVTGNVVKDFQKGYIQSQTTKNVSWHDNKCIGSTHTDECFAITGVSYSFLTIDGLSCQASTRCVNTTGATSDGNSRLAGVTFDDATTLALAGKFNLSSWITDDSNVFTLARGVQAETCPDDAAPALTLNPYYDTVQIKNLDTTPDSCTVTMGELWVSHGTRVSIMVTSTTNPATVDFTDTSGVSELAGNFAMENWDTLSLIYGGDGTADRWVETGRSNN